MTDSDVVTALPLNLQGVWVHDPDNPQQTIIRYVYSDSSDRSRTFDVETEGHLYAGRVYPVFDYSEHETNKVNVSVEIIRDDPYFPSSGTFQDLLRFVRSRKIVVLRDGSGRFVQGPITGLQETGVHYGYSASFTVESADVERVTL